MKSTNAVINGAEKAIFKDPKTDSGLKKSLKGRIAVARNPFNGELVALDDEMYEERADVLNNGHDLLETVWKDGKFVKYLGFDEVRRNTGLVA